MPCVPGTAGSALAFSAWRRWWRRNRPAMETKTCEDCGQLFAYERVRSPRKFCDACRTVAKQCERWRKRNLQKKHEAAVRYRKEHLLKEREGDRVYRENNREIVRMCDQRYREKNRAKVREKDKRYRDMYPERVREASRKKLHQRRAALVGMGPESAKLSISLNELARREGERCYICGRKVDMKLASSDPMSATMDHFLPLIPRNGEVGGDNRSANIRLAHMKCNSQKNNRAWPGQILLIG